jgi:transcriptional regulator with XRE-family HTH domain
MQAPKSSLGATIKQLREGNGFTQERLAEYLGIGRITLTHYETGTRNPPLPLLEKLATLYGLELADLLAPDATTLALNAAFAFRSSGDPQLSHLKQIASFRRIVANYLKMKRLDTLE